MIRTLFVVSLLLSGLLPTASAVADTTTKPATLDVSQANNYLLDAARAGDVGLVNDLLKAGVNIETRNKQGHTALTLAAYSGQLEVLDALIAAGADINSGDMRGNTPLMGAIFKGNTAVFERLLAATTIDVNQRNGASQTAIMYAALFSREAMIDRLLQRGADLGAMDATGKRASMLARMQGNDVLADRLDTLLPKAP